MRSAMVHSFSEVPRADIPRSSFDRSHRYGTTFDADYLVPVYFDDVVPGDTFNLNMEFFARLATPLYPIMDHMYLESFFFFVPYRLVWDNWTKMHGEQDNPTDTIDYTVPVVGTGLGVGQGDVSNYFGLPIGLTTNTTTHAISALPFRAYRLIWNEWFRNQNLDDSVDVVTDDGPDTDAETGFTSAPLKRRKRHDYFTASLPSPQKGDAVSLPLGTSADVYMNNNSAGATLWVGDNLTGGTDLRAMQADASTNIVEVSASTSTGTPALFADLSGATAATINDLRLAFQTQRLLERDARSGTRYNELILAHFGVTVPDYRVQRPEFLGGGSERINVQSVAQTSGQPTPAANDKLGHLASFGTVSGTHGFTKSFTEHGIIIGMINVRSDITYSQGIERYWSKSTRFDFYYPVLAQIGEQAVLMKEIYEGAASPDNAWGFQERYAEYRYKPSRWTGLFQVGVAGTLAAWHLSEELTSEPSLGTTFIESNTATPLDRAIQIPSEPQFIFDSWINLQCARPMPLHGVPGNLDHF